MNDQLKSCMRSVIKQKVHSALCNVDAVEAYNKNLYAGHLAKHDHDENELIAVPDDSIKQRSHHGDIQPPAMRIQGYKHRTFGKKYENAVAEVKRKDHELSLLKESKDKQGLMTAQLGSIYDIPVSMSSDVAST